MYAWSLLGFEPNKQGEVHRYELLTLKARAYSMMSRSGVISSLALEN
jgi:tRNA U34 5-methylaminomethyl-2-thiouridine-forming methyltransferase MnmC